jgi:hypothetical protein
MLTLENDPGKFGDDISKFLLRAAENAGVSTTAIPINEISRLSNSNSSVGFRKPEFDKYESRSARC